MMDNNVEHVEPPPAQHELPQRRGWIRRRRPVFGLLAMLAVLGVGLFATYSYISARHSEIDYSDINTSCTSLSKVVTHIHLHISIYVDDHPVVIPKNTGIATKQGHTCYYWLHTHDTSGVLHVESPTSHTFQLGDFLRIWQQRFHSHGYPDQLGYLAGRSMWMDSVPLTIFIISHYAAIC
ncbi:hypothetical protein [Dictyobacter kobayashii]|uniref:Uncharacterized protein n=1 Tax=Dictyobacter kobayashii TaxID=2014872 RepID=A0A402APD2_9CHLR|nr:hypothetical protein [Dictyobacter kobayashii]GCE21051.1 hypothetical protein KDK_48510 [Dictyobacter kobayashii]